VALTGGAARLLAKRTPATHEISVDLVSAYVDRDLVVARGGLRIIADATIANAPDFDLLLVPGGVTSTLEQDAAAMSWLAQRKSTPIIASVCTGVFLLAKAQIITDQAVTTHWEDLSELAERYSQLNVVDDQRWIQQGNIYTSAGISAGIDLALHLTGLVDPALPAQVARQMDYA